MLLDNYCALWPDSVVHELDVVRVGVEVQRLGDEGEVVEAGVHRHHAPAQRRHRHREHPDVGSQVCVLNIFTIGEDSLLSPPKIGMFIQKVYQFSVR